jgi:hypothetical protein
VRLSVVGIVPYQQVSIIHSTLRRPQTRGSVSLDFGPQAYAGQTALRPHVAAIANVYLTLSTTTLHKRRNFIGDIALVDQYGNKHWARGIRFQGKERQ